MSPSGVKAYDLFVSYAAADRALAEGWLLDGLRSAGVACLTQGDFSLGAQWTAEFERAVAESHRVLLVLSRAYLADVISRIVNGHPQSRLDELLPWAYPTTPALKAAA